MPVVTIDRTGHLVEASELAVAHYREKHGLDLLSRIGVSIKDHSHSQAMPEVWDTVKQSGVLEGDVMLLRLLMNHGGSGHITIYEPIFRDGESVGVSAYIAREVELPPMEVRTPRLELADVIRFESPDQMEVVYRAPSNAGR